MTNCSTWILGNRLDVLADLLARVLEEEGADPFAARVILVPSGEMKSWLLLELARRSVNGGVAGLKIFSWQEGVRYLLNQPGKELSYLQLYLLVYEELRKSEAVEEYLEQARLVDLASEVTDLFLKYGYYGKGLELEGWQGEIWRKLFVEGSWRVPVQLFQEGLKGSVYCFGCLMMPPLVWETLVKMADVKIFMFSPTAFYWADICSDRERRSMVRSGKRRGVSQGQIEALQGYLLEAHPLLANWGKVGRDVFALLEETEIEVELVYDPLEGRDGMLAGLQKDLLWNRKSVWEKEDGSIRVHQTGASRLREVQVLKDEMLRLHRKGVGFSEMLILAPDIQIYAPLIEMVFSDLELGIACQLSGVDRSMQNGSWRGFKRLLDLAFSRWEVDDLLLLFETASFWEKRGWDLERLDQIRSWIREAKVRWGKTEEDKKIKLSEWLDGEHFEKKGTWDAASEKIIDSLIYLFSPDAESGKLSGIAGLSLSQADEAEEFLELLFQLQSDLAPLSKELKSPIAWAEVLRDLFEKYFIKEGFEALEEVLYSLRKAGEKMREPIAFEALLHLFERKETISIGSTLLHAARFASIEEGSITPCRALFLIGQDEESFPRRFVPSSLDALKGTKEAPPSSSDVDRYLFLQAVSSARDYLVISYGHISPEDGKEVGASILVRELLGYLRVVKPIAQPSFPWHERCFLEKNCLLTTRKDYAAALAFQKTKKPLQFFPSLEKKIDPKTPEGEVFIRIKDLKSAFSHPWKFYLQKKLHLYFEELEEEDWSDFEINPLQRAKFLKESFKTSMDQVVEKNREKDAFPVGLFGEMFERRLGKTYDEWKSHLDEWDMQSSEWFTLHLVEEPKEFFEKKQLALEIDGTLVKIGGEIRHVCLKGPIHFREDNFSELLKSWPEYLATLCALEKKEIFCIRSGKMHFIENPLSALKECIRLYFLAEENPLPLIADWTDALIRKQDPIELEKKFEGNFRGRQDLIYDWVLLHSEPFCSKNLVSSWGPYLQERFQTLLDLYPIRGKKHAKV